MSEPVTTAILVSAVSAAVGGVVSTLFTPKAESPKIPAINHDKANDAAREKRRRLASGGFAANILAGELSDEESIRKLG